MELLLPELPEDRPLGVVVDSRRNGEWSDEKGQRQSAVYERRSTRKRNDERNRDE